MTTDRQAVLNDIIQELGYSFAGEIRVGGDYVPVVREGNLAYVSGQVPRVGSTVVVTGRVGAEVDLPQAQLGARVSTVRALLLLAQSLGGLEHIKRVIRVSVFVQSAPDFTMHSEVADAASALLRRVLGEAGSHARTSVGVYQLPKNAALEVEMTVSTHAE